MPRPYSILRSLSNDIPRVGISIYTANTDELTQWLETIRDRIPVQLDRTNLDYLYCIDSDFYNLHVGDCAKPSVRTEECTILDEETFKKKVEEAIADLYILR